MRGEKSYGLGRLVGGVVVVGYIELVLIVVSVRIDQGFVNDTHDLKFWKTCSWMRRNLLCLPFSKFYGSLLLCRDKKFE